MLENTLHRLSSQRAACKQWSVLLAVVILLMGGLGKLNATNLLWAGAPLLLLGFTEAGYAAQVRRGEDYLRSRKSSNDDSPLAPESATASAARWGMAAMSLSIWPFYLALFSIVAAGGGAFSKAASNGGGRFVQTAMVQPAACSSNASSGCGSAAGCGTGGCGASSGRACSCGGGASKGAAGSWIQPQRMPVRQQQQYLQTQNGPMPIQYSPQGGPNGMTLPARAPVIQPAIRSIPPNGAQPAIVQPGPPSASAIPSAPSVIPAPPVHPLPNPASAQPAPVTGPPAPVEPGARVPAGTNP